jgi:hypothetical protein
VFELLAYSKASGGASADQDMVAATDPDYSTRSNHYILTEQYNLLGAAFVSATALRANVKVPTWNAISLFNIWPVMASATIPSPPAMAWFTHAPPPLPMNEEIQIQQTDNASETGRAFLWLAPGNWNANLPAGSLLIPVRFTVTFTTTTNAWGGPIAMTFEQSLRGGVYSVVGAQVQCTAGDAFRLIFPRARMYMGRKMRPGFLCQSAIGDLEEVRIYSNPFYLGEWGRFHTFEPPQFEIFASTGASRAIEGRLWLVYLGGDMGQLNAWAAGGA